MITSTKTLRRAFWQLHFGVRAPRIITPDVRMMFVEFVDNCHRAGVISDRLAQSATLA